MHIKIGRGHAAVIPVHHSVLPVPVLFGAAAVDAASTATLSPFAWRLHMQRARRWLLVALAAVLAMMTFNIVHARDRDALARRGRAVTQATELLATQIANAVQSAATLAQMLLSLSEQRPNPRDITRTLDETLQHYPAVAAILVADAGGHLVAMAHRDTVALPALAAFSEQKPNDAWPGVTLLHGREVATGLGLLGLRATTPFGADSGRPGLGYQVVVFLRGADLPAIGKRIGRMWLFGAGHAMIVGPGDAADGEAGDYIPRAWLGTHANTNAVLPMDDGAHQLIVRRLEEWPLTLVVDAGVVHARPGAFGRPRNLLTSALGVVALLALLSAIVSLWRAGRAAGRNTVTAEGRAGHASPSAVELSNDDVDAARRVASVAAHEVNNLLTTMSFDAEMVAELYPGNLRLAQLSRSMLAAAGRGAVLTQNLLAYAEGALLQPRLVDICHELRACQADLVACLPSGQALIIGRTVFAKRGELVRLDPAALTLSLGALLADCTEAAGMRAEIRIDVTCEMRRGVPYEVVVIETAGMGLDLDGLGHHAEPQLGLGAAAAAGFARQSGGFLAIEYTADHSLRARFGFPICNGLVAKSDSRHQPRRECASRAGSSRAISPRPTVRVLLVDDCEPVRDSIARRLRGAGYAVLEAQDAAHAEILARRGVDVLLTDIVLIGGADGGALAKRVRAHIPTLPVVFMSGFLSVRQSEVMAGDELASFVRKPIEVGDLCTLIDGLIALRESRRLAQPAA